jgi:phage FluMu gp28-like protein
MDGSFGNGPTGTLWTERCQFLVENLGLPSAAEVDNARWEPFQLRHLCDDSTFRIEDKSRQIAWSFTVAAEAVANAILEEESTVFVSINQEEAKEKVRYARKVYENLGIGGLPGIVRDNELGLEFDNGARLTSLPSRPPRGKARTHVVLDEFAHVQRDRDIYTAALPIISKGGRLRIGSSPFGARGIHWEIARQELRAYPGYTRVQTPWWRVRYFCNQWPLPPGIGQLTTEERVPRYASDRLVTIFDNMLLDDFQQEYECLYVDDSVSWIAWEMIQANQEPNLLWWWAKSVDQALDLIPTIQQEIVDSHMEQVLAGGVDVGRHKHLTEIVLVGMGQVYPLRLRVSLDRVKYDGQEQCIKQLLAALPIKALLIDQNGIGNQLAERLQASTVAEGVTFSNATKELWATEAKVQMERQRAIIPAERDLAYQIHSIKKKVTAAKNNVFDTEGNEKHHADAFWAWALALWAVRGDQAGQPFFATIPGRRR